MSDAQPVYLVLTPTQLDVLRITAGVVLGIVVAAFVGYFGARGPRA